MEFKLLNEEDEMILTSFYQNQDVMKMITGDPLSLPAIKRKWQNIMSWDHLQGYGYYQLKEDDQCIGVGCLKPFQGDVEIGYMVYPQYWHKGYGTMICKFLMSRIQAMNVKRIVAYIDPQNIASRKILENYGFQILYCHDDEAFLEKRL